MNPVNAASFFAQYGHRDYFETNRHNRVKLPMEALREALKQTGWGSYKMQYTSRGPQCPDEAERAADRYDSLGSFIQSIIDERLRAPQ